MLTSILWGSYVHSLYKRLQTMTHHGSTHAPLAYGSTERDNTTHGILIPFPTVELTAIPIENRPTGYLQSTMETCFFGSSSSLMHLEYALSKHSQSLPTLQNPEDQAFFAYDPTISDYPDPKSPPQSLSAALFTLFSKSVNLFYPTVKEPQISRLLEYSSNQVEAVDEHDYEHDYDHDIFYLIMAIATQLTRKWVHGQVYSPHVYFHKATHYPERSRKRWLQLDSLLLLQRHLLICIYLLFSPDSGDIWRNLGFAIRLYFDLSHRPTEHDNMDEELMTMLFRTLYSLERYIFPCGIDFKCQAKVTFSSQASIAFGRPSLLVIGDKLREVGSPIAPDVNTSS